MTGSARSDVIGSYDCIANEFKVSRRKPWPSLKELGSCKGMSVLDLGAGTGRNAVALAESGAEFVVAADISIGMLKALIANGRFLDRIMPIRCDAMALPFKAESFDSVVCIAMVHHIAGKDNRRGALKEAGRTMKSGGEILVTVWSRLQSRFTKHLPSMIVTRVKGGEYGDVLIPWGRKATRFYHLYTKRELESDLIESKFKVEKSRGEKIKSKIFDENWVALGKKG